MITHLHFWQMQPPRVCLGDPAERSGVPAGVAEKYRFASDCIEKTRNR